MVRLIDADLLMENYDLKSATKYGNKTAQQQRHGYGTLMMYEIADMIEDAPTAYDVEAVVAEIQKILKDTMHIRANKDVNKDFYKGLECAYKVVIEIVRRGGVK